MGAFRFVHDQFGFTSLSLTIVSDVSTAVNDQGMMSGDLRLLAELGLPSIATVTSELGHGLSDGES